MQNEAIRGMTFTQKILLGLVLGVAVGVFLGDLAGSFSTAGNIFIGLLQMTVLPYIVVSLIANLGRVSWSESRRLLTSAILVLLLLLLLGMIILFVIPVAFPTWSSGSFFRSALVEPDRVLDLVALYIPANPFNSLANNLVPAVVLFSILLGVGVSGVPGNQGLLNALAVLEESLIRINKVIITLTPLGVFAIAAGTAGTISLAELSRLQAYLITYTVIAGVLSFIVLPLLVSAVTPFKHRDLIAIPKDTLIMIFATAKIIVFMPQLVANVKKLFQMYDLDDETTTTGAEVLMPLAYPFPNLGTYTILMFVPFSAWYLGRSLDVGEQLLFQGSSLLSSFVAPVIGVPFLLDVMRIPADMMELFVMSTVYTDRIRVVLGAVHLLSLTIVTLCITRGCFKLDYKKLLKALLLSLLALGIALFSIRSLLDKAVNSTYSGDSALVEMRWMDRTVPVKLYRDELPPISDDAVNLGRLTAIRERGTLRVGFFPDSLPFAFLNDKSEAIGFDIEMAHMLASDLDVELEIVRTQYADINRMFAEGRLDIVMSGLAITPQRALSTEFSASPLDLTLGLLVADHRRKAFSSANSILRQKDLHFGIVQADNSFHRIVETSLPGVKTSVITSPRGFLKGEKPELDAVVYSAEGGSAWTLIYPDYSIVVPKPLIMHVSAAYPLPSNDSAWANFVSRWVEIKKKEGTVDALFDHWIMGLGAESLAPRWSVVRDVLHWVE